MGQALSGHKSRFSSNAKFYTPEPATTTYSSIAIATASPFNASQICCINRHGFDLPFEVWIMIAHEIRSTYITLIPFTRLAATCQRLDDIFFPLLMQNAPRHRLRSHNNMTVFHWASERGYTRVVNGLLEAGGDVNALDRSGSSALMLATIGGHKSVVECLITHNAAVDVISPQGQTALTHAACSNHPDILIRLFNYGAKFEPRHWWTILSAACGGHLEVVRILLDHGVDPNFRLWNPPDDTCARQYCTRKSALRLAVMHRHPDLVELLKRKGADPEQAIQDLVSKSSPFCTRDKRCLYELCGRSRRRTIYWRMRHSHGYARHVVLRVFDVITERLGPLSVLIVFPPAVVVFFVYWVSLGLIVLYGRLCL